MESSQKKAVIFFLAFVFAITIGLSAAAKLMGLSLAEKPDLMAQMVVAGAMFIPAVGAILAQKYFLRRPLKELGFKLGPKKLYGQVYVVILLVFVVVYGLSWLLGARPDFTLQSFVGQYGLSLPLPPALMLLISAVATLLVAPILNLLPSLGEEIGWRGFLLPNLLPGGVRRACLLAGIVWGAWHLPFIMLLGFAYGSHWLLGAGIFLLLVTCLGVYFNYLRLKSDSVWLSTFAHAVFNAHAYGVWVMVFIIANPLWLGKAGLLSAFVWLVVAVYIWHKKLPALAKPELS